MSETEALASQNPAAAEPDDDDEDDSLLVDWEKLHGKIEQRQSEIGGEPGLAKLRDAKNVRGELLNWVYELLKEVVKTGAAQTTDVEDAFELIAEMRAELDRLGNLTRIVASSNYVQLVQILVQLVLARSQDLDTRNVAQQIFMLFSPVQLVAAPVDPQQPQVVVQPTTNVGGGTP